MATEPEQPEYGLVMPFILVTSRGGPYDDHAYVAGWNMGALEAEMRIARALGTTPKARYLSPVDEPQVDLLAMRFGFTVTATAHDVDWTLYEFEPAQEGAE